MHIRCVHLVQILPDLDKTWRCWYVLRELNQNFNFVRFLRDPTKIKILNLISDLLDMFNITFLNPIPRPKVVSKIYDPDSNVWFTWAIYETKFLNTTSDISMMDILYSRHLSITETIFRTDWIFLYQFTSLKWIPVVQTFLNTDDIC